MYFKIEDVKSINARKFLNTLQPIITTAQKENKKITLDFTDFNEDDKGTWLFNFCYYFVADYNKLHFHSLFIIRDDTDNGDEFYNNKITTLIETNIKRIEKQKLLKEYKNSYSTRKEKIREYVLDKINNENMKLIFELIFTDIDELNDKIEDCENECDNLNYNNYNDKIAAL